MPKGTDTFSMVEAREQLTRLPERLAQEMENQTGISAIKVTRHNEPVLAILSWDLYESIMETLEILGDREQMLMLLQGIQEANEGKGKLWKTVKKELGWEHDTDKVEKVRKPTFTKSRIGCSKRGCYYCLS